VVYYDAETTCLCSIFFLILDALHYPLILATGRCTVVVDSMSTLSGCLLYMGIACINRI
jgi:hypothetical protein